MKRTTFDWILSLAIAFSIAGIMFGCSKEDPLESLEERRARIIPDSLSFTKKIERLIPHSLFRLQTLAENHADSTTYAAINLMKFVPYSEVDKMFENRGFTIHQLYYGMGAFSGIYPVDPTIPMDSTLALLRLEARTELAENIRLGSEEVANIADEVQRKKVEEELDRMRTSLVGLDQSGPQFYGAEVEGRPPVLLALMQHPDQLVRVVFPGQPSDGSWVRLSPARYQVIMDNDRQVAQ